MCCSTGAPVFDIVKYTRVGGCTVLSAGKLGLLLAACGGKFKWSLGGFRRKPSRSSDGTPDDRFSVHVHQLKHIVIEACAFGAALARTEQAIDEAHGLDPASKPLLTRLH